MKLNPSLNSASRRARGAVLILVLWIAFGLVVLAIHFADAMRFELRAADNRAAAVAAEQAAEGAARYVKLILENQETNGILPDRTAYLSQEVAVGDAAFWLIGRPDEQDPLNQIVFALVDESSKLNLNTATSAMLQSLPNMTAEIADAIVDWRDEDEDAGENGAETEVYARLSPARACKNARFETVEELRLVYGIELTDLYGEDFNRNGLLDPNEDDGDLTWPPDDSDGRLDPGLIEYVTVSSRQPNKQADGSAKTSVNNRQQVQTLLQSTFDQQRAQELMAGYPPNNANFNSVLAYYAANSQMTAAEFRQIEDQLTTNANAAVIEGLVNINTASEDVLACIPGIGLTNAPTIIAYRQSNPDELDSLAWVKEVLSTAAMTQAGPYLTGKTYQFSADVAALGRHNRGYRRIRYVFDTSETEPKVVERQELTHLGWALGPDLREEMQLARLSQR